MNDQTQRSLDLAFALARRGFTIATVEVHTPDGRTWSIDTVPAGRGRHADGHWGPMADAPGGFRLFEIDRDQGTFDEHDAVEGDAWEAGDLLDYLAAVGLPRNPRSTRPSNPPTT